MAKKGSPEIQKIFRNELNIESIISAPLIAVSKANAFMLTGQYRYLIDNCFELKEGHHAPIMINMSLSRTEINHNKLKGEDDFIKTELIFTVPKLCLIPFSSLAVNNVTVDFDMEITSTTSYESKHGVLDKQAQLNGRISYEPRSGDELKSKSQKLSRLKVNIKASSLPLPSGLLNIIDLYNKSIQPMLSAEKQNQEQDNSN